MMIMQMTIQNATRAIVLNVQEKESNGKYSSDCNCVGTCGFDSDNI